MASKRIERCWKCDEPTGRAGRGDGSIYDDNGHGPYCEDCRRVNLLVFDEYAKDLRQEQAVSAWEDEVGSKRHWRDEEEYESAKELVRKGAT